MQAFDATLNRNNLDAPAYKRSPIALTETFCTCTECGSLATLRLDRFARRFECINDDCKHAIMAELVEVRE